jgi:hypothetical protein
MTCVYGLCDPETDSEAFELLEQELAVKPGGSSNPEGLDGGACRRGGNSFKAAGDSFRNQV